MLQFRSEYASVGRKVVEIAELEVLEKKRELLTVWQWVYLTAFSKALRRD